jgi:HrpA-like RNA helicase
MVRFVGTLATIPPACHCVPSSARIVSSKLQLRSQVMPWRCEAYPKVRNPLCADLIDRCITSAFFSNAAHLSHEGKYRMVRGDQTVVVHPKSVVFRSVPEWVVFTEFVHTAQPYMRNITVIDPMWLTELAPHYFSLKSGLPQPKKQKHV